MSKSVKAQDQNTKASTKNEAKANMLDVSIILKGLKYDEAKYEAINFYDVDEFTEPRKERKAYRNIRSRVDNRSIVKLWGHKDFVAVECSKMLRKRENIDVAKGIYQAKDTDKNNNYICRTYTEAIELANDFITQVTASVYSEKTTKATASEKKTSQKKAR